jgi:hypothetical protein
MQRKQTVQRRLAGSNLHLMPSNGDQATLQHHADRKKTMIPLPSNYLPLLTETRRNKDIIWRRGEERAQDTHEASSKIQSSAWSVTVERQSSTYFHCTNYFHRH